MQGNVTLKRILTAGAVSLCVLLFLLGMCVADIYGASDSVTVNAVRLRDFDLRTEDGVDYIGQGFRVAGYTDSVMKGGSVDVTVSAQVPTNLSISVYYPSGKSTSDALTNKTARDGNPAKWSFRVPSTIKANELRVVIRSDTGYATFRIAVSE